MTVSDLLEQPCNKSDNAIKLVTSSWDNCQLTTINYNTSSAIAFQIFLKVIVLDVFLNRQKHI
jgi:hypothetical protein